MPIPHLTEETFAQAVTPGPVLVEFQAPWCTYCRRLTGIMDQLAERMPVRQVNIDEQPALARRFAIDTIPTLLLFRNGAPGAPLIAPTSKALIDTWLAAQRT